MDEKKLGFIGQQVNGNIVEFQIEEFQKKSEDRQVIFDKERAKLLYPVAQKSIFKRKILVIQQIDKIEKKNEKNEKPKRSASFVEKPKSDLLGKSSLTR